jgi:hypothetical protein
VSKTRESLDGCGDDGGLEPGCEFEDSLFFIKFMLDVNNLVGKVIELSKSSQVFHKLPICLTEFGCPDM